MTSAVVFENVRTKTAHVPGKAGKLNWLKKSSMFSRGKGDKWMPVDRSIGEIYGDLVRDTNLPVASPLDLGLPFTTGPRFTATFNLDDTENSLHERQ